MVAKAWFLDFLEHLERSTLASISTPEISRSTKGTLSCAFLHKGKHHIFDMEHEMGLPPERAAATIVERADKALAGVA